VEATSDHPGPLALGADPDAPRRARQFLRHQLERLLPADVLDVVLLLGTEVVTNAVRHAAAPILLAVAIDPRTVRIEVADGSRHEPVRRFQGSPFRGRPVAASGRGLHLLDVLAADWGVAVREPGKVVWFTVSRVASAPS